MSIRPSAGMPAIGVGVMVISPLIKKLMHLDTLVDDTIDDDLLGQAEGGRTARAVSTGNPLSADRSACLSANGSLHRQMHLTDRAGAAMLRPDCWGFHEDIHLARLRDRYRACRMFHHERRRQCRFGRDQRLDGAGRGRQRTLPSTYTPYPGRPTALVGATVFDGRGGRIDNGTVLFRDGKVVAVGDASLATDGYDRIDGSGKFVTPGVIDIHSHLGDYPTPSVQAHSDGNEATSPMTPEVWAEHSVWPQDPGFTRALANGGVTSLQILPGSANLTGGRSVTLKNVSARTVQGMKFPGAPYGMKMACGENPKRVYGGKGRMPSTRMGNFAVNRQMWLDAQAYDGKKRDLGKETLKGVLDGEILVHNHCYRADEMALVMDMAKEMGYKVTAFHHAVEAYKIGDLLRENDVRSAIWADWYGFKMKPMTASSRTPPSSSAKAPAW